MHGLAVATYRIEDNAVYEAEGKILIKEAAEEDPPVGQRSWRICKQTLSVSFQTKPCSNCNFLLEQLGMCRSDYYSAESIARSVDEQDRREAAYS